MPSYFTFVHLPTYVASSEDVVSDEEQRDLEERLCDNPETGARITGTGGVRKVRIAASGRGRRGGARVIYFFHAGNEKIYLIYVYPKNEKDNLTYEQKRRIKGLVEILKQEQ